MPQESIDILLAQYEATNERDFPRAMSYYADDVELVVHPEASLERGTFSGREAVGRWFGNWLSTFEPGYHFEVTETRDLGDVVLLIASTHGRGRTSGAEVHGEVAYLYEVRDGKIVRAELFASRAAALEAAPDQT
jgi:ketosteroid isomerase-like protein